MCHYGSSLCFYIKTPHMTKSQNTSPWQTQTGGKIIFVNGYLGFGSPYGGRRYWNNPFARGAMQFFNAQLPPFFTDINHSAFSFFGGREQNGYKWAKANHSSLTANLLPNHEIIIIAHSMGGTFAMGIKSYLQQPGYNIRNILFLNT